MRGGPKKNLMKGGPIPETPPLEIEKVELESQKEPLKLNAPDEIWWTIARNLDVFSLLTLQLTCRRLLKIGNDENLWCSFLKSIRESSWIDPFEVGYQLDGKNWRLHPNGKCKGRFMTHLREFFTITKAARNPPDYFYHLSCISVGCVSKFPRTLEDQKNIIMESRFLFNRAVGHYGYICTGCLNQQTRCRTCRYTFVMTWEKFRQCFYSSSCIASVEEDVSRRDSIPIHKSYFFLNVKLSQYLKHLVL